MSLRQIAEMTGASVATVSRVLNNPEYQCQDATLGEKIRQAARELHYVPNESARQLKMGKGSGDVSESFVVDVLLTRFDTLGEDLFFTEVFRHLETELYKQNCAVGKVLNVPDISLMNATGERTRAQGLIILGKCQEELLKELNRRYQGITAIDRNPMDYAVDEIVCSGSRAADMAVEYLMELGHTKIGYIGDCNMEARYTGYYECLLKHKIPLTYDFVVATNQTAEEGARAFERLASLKGRPTAVFCANDVTALGFLKAMKEKNGRRKKDVYRPAVVSIDDIEAASANSPMLTTVHIPKEDMVHLAVLTLKDRLQGGHRECIRLELPCHLMVRESSGVHLI